jgi:hypothetical protein
VAVDTANGRSNATYWNSHGVDTIIIRYGLLGLGYFIMP